MSSPARLYCFSDTYGGHAAADPLSCADADAHICTDFGSAVEHPVYRTFDIFGRERATDHLLRLILQQHDDFVRRGDLTEEQRKYFLDGGTGVFINSAPRTDRKNGEPFYLASLRGGAIRIVVTPLSALSAIRDAVETLAYLPNPASADEPNGLYSHTEQFRSRLTPVLLHSDCTLPLISIDPKDIPPYDRPWHVAYVDRFGNIITWTGDKDGEWHGVTSASNAAGKVRVKIGHTEHEIEIGSSLAHTTPGGLAIYKNGNIDIVRKWEKGDTALTKLERSAYEMFGRPEIGSEVGVAG